LPMLRHTPRLRRCVVTSGVVSRSVDLATHGEGAPAGVDAECVHWCDVMLVFGRIIYQAS
jgi:hypothetical protein